MAFAQDSSRALVSYSPCTYCSLSWTIPTAQRVASEASSSSSELQLRERLTNWSICSKPRATRSFFEVVHPNSSGEKRLVHQTWPNFPNLAADQRRWEPLCRSGSSLQACCSNIWQLLQLEQPSRLRSDSALSLSFSSLVAVTSLSLSLSLCPTLVSAAQGRLPQRGFVKTSD